MCTGVGGEYQSSCNKYVVSCNFSLYIFFSVKVGSLPDQRLTIDRQMT